MNRFFFLFLLITVISIPLFSQKKLQRNIQQWQKSVVNLETEGQVFSKFKIDQKIDQYKRKGYSTEQLDSIHKALSSKTSYHTGTAIYVKDGDRKYLITAKHVLLDSVQTKQKIYDKAKGLINWNDVEAIYSRISIRTPVEMGKNNLINNRAVYNYNSANSITPYVLIPDDINNDLGIISLQEKNYKLLDDILQKDGYEPISINKICSKSSLRDGDDIYTIGFPENISVVGTVNVAKDTKLYQLNQVISPFTSFGKISMSNEALNFFYADLTISFGNSGGPVIKNNKLIGIISGVNKYSILSDNESAAAAGRFYGVGHLVKVIKCTDIVKYLRILQTKEDDPSFNK